MSDGFILGPVQEEPLDLLSELKQVHQCVEGEGKPFSLATGFDGNTYCPYCKKYFNVDHLRGDMTTGEFMGVVQGLIIQEKNNDDGIETLEEGEDIIFEDQSWREEDDFKYT